MSQAATLHSTPSRARGTTRHPDLQLGHVILESVLSFAVGWGLYTLAQPLASMAEGRNAVYAITPGVAPTSLVAQARWLQSHVGELLAGWAVAGWLVLALARQALPASGFVCGAAALWLTAWGGYAQAWQGAHVWQVAGYNAWWMLAGLCMLLWPLLTRLCGRVQVELGLVRPVPQRQCLRSAWLYPGFVCLSGVGVLWLLDYAARGPGPKALLGLRHLWAWLAAVAIFTLAAGLRLRLMGALGWVMSRAEGSGHRHTVLRWLVPVLAVLWGVGLVLAGRQGVLLPAVTNELLRVPLYLLGGWVLYRWLGAASQRGWHMNLRVLLRLALVALGVVLALAALHDNGPMLVLGYTACVLVAVLTLHAWMQRHPRSSVLLTVLLSVALVLGLNLLLVQGLAPMLSSLAQRLETLTLLNSASDAQDAPVLPLDFLHRLHWFMQSAPASGYGLGHTPWCGYAGNLGSACEVWVPRLLAYKDNGLGLPWQVPSDYAFAGLLGVWGVGAACALWVGLVLWLWRLLPQPSELRRMGTLGPVNPDVLALWAVALFAVASMVQSMVTVLGTLAVTPMTGITLPLLSYGTSSLLVSAFFAGLGALQLRQPPTGLR